MDKPQRTIEELERALAVQKRITEAAITTAAHWEDVSEELVWGDEARREKNYEGPISERHMTSVILKFPQYEADIRSFVGHWNYEPRLTEEMLAAVEVKPEDVERSTRRAMQIIHFYDKLRNVEAERDRLASLNKGLMDERDRLASLNAELAQAVRGMFKLIESGYFIRDTSHDSDSDWTMKQVGPVLVLKHAQEALAKCK